MAHSGPSAHATPCRAGRLGVISSYAPPIGATKSGGTYRPNRPLSTLGNASFSAAARGDDLCHPLYDLIGRQATRVDLERIIRAPQRGDGPGAVTLVTFD